MPKYVARLGLATAAGFEELSGDVPDRPIDRSIRFNTPLWTWSSTGSYVAYRLLRQPRGHNKARIRNAAGRRARSTDRPIDRSTNRFDSIPHFGPGPQQALMYPTGYTAILGGTTKRGFGKPPGDARDRPIDRSTHRPIDSIQHLTLDLVRNRP